MLPPSFQVLAAHPRTQRVARTLWSRITVFAITALVLEWVMYRAIVAAAHGPSEPLDDVFIHFQYARSIAEGHPFRYGSPFDARTSGETSPAYGFALAVLYVVGFRGLRLIVGAHLLGAAGWTLTAEGMYRVGLRAWGVVAAWGSALVAFACAGLVWAAGSGMETIFAVATSVWVFATIFALDEERTHTQAITLGVLSFVAPFVRPELAALSVLGACVIALRAMGRDRAYALLALFGAVAVPLFWKAVTGSWRSTGSSVKLILYDPYLTHREILIAIASHTGLMLKDVLAGKGWAHRYFPENANLVAAVGFVVVVVRAFRRGRPVTALAWFGALAFMAAPTACFSWDIHRYRYLWEVFVLPLVCMVVACAAAGVLLERVLVKLGNPVVRGMCTAGLVGGLLALFAYRIPDGIDDLADCGRCIRQQQILLAYDLHRLPRGATVTINDAGVLAYLGEHRTIDFVGLTTQGFGEAFVNGHGSTFEALEALPRADRPQFAALYRGWMDNTLLLGPTIMSRVVEQTSILGGPVMDVAAVRSEMFDTGATPLDPLAPGERIVDEMDTALIESEHAHGYDNVDDHKDDNVLSWGTVPRRGTVLEGGRTVRRREGLNLHGDPGHPARLLIRVGTWGRTAIRVVWNGVTLDASRVIGLATGITDQSFTVPANLVHDQNRVETVALDRFGFASCHYFVVASAR